MYNLKVSDHFSQTIFERTFASKDSLNDFVTSYISHGMRSDLDGPTHITITFPQDEA